MAQEQPLVGASVVDGSGQVFGTVSALMVNPLTRQGQWVRIDLDLAGQTGGRALPLAAASVDATGQVVVPWSAATVAGAPAVGTEITLEQGQDLATYFHLTV